MKKSNSRKPSSPSRSKRKAPSKHGFMQDVLAYYIFSLMSIAAVVLLVLER